MKSRPLKSKHSHNNRESREGEVLRYVREARKLSLNDVAVKLKLKSIEIDHYENGRKFYSMDNINTFLECYQLSQEDFQKIMNFKILTKQLVNHFLIAK